MLDQLATRLGEADLAALERRSRALAWARSAARARGARAPRRAGARAGSTAVERGERRPFAASCRGSPAVAAIPSADLHALARRRAPDAARCSWSCPSSRSRSAAGSPLAPQRPAGAPGRAARWTTGVVVVVDVSSSTLGYSPSDRPVAARARARPAAEGGARARLGQRLRRPAAGGARARRCDGWQRLISFVSASNRKIAARAKQDRTPIPYPTPGDYPWAGVFTGGTRLSCGLARATQALRESGATHGQIVLISDLRDAPDDLPRVSAAITACTSSGMQLRVVVVGNAPRDRKAFSDKGGADFVISAADAVYAPRTAGDAAVGTAGRPARRARRRARRAADGGRAAPATPALGRGETERRPGEAAHGARGARRRRCCSCSPVGAALLVSWRRPRRREFRRTAGRTGSAACRRRPPSPGRCRRRRSACSACGRAASCCGRTSTTAPVSQT